MKIVKAQWKPGDTVALKIAPSIYHVIIHPDLVRELGGLRIEGDRVYTNMLVYDPYTFKPKYISYEKHELIFIADAPSK